MVLSSLAFAGPHCYLWGFVGGSVVKNLPANAGDTSSVPGWGRYSGGGNGNPLQYSYLWNPMDEEPGSLQSMRSQESDTTERLSTPCYLWYWVTSPALGQGAPSQCVPLMPSFSSFQVHSSQATFSWEMNIIFREPATRLSQSIEKQIEDDSIRVSLLIKIFVYTWRNINCFLLKEDWLECRIENGSDAELNKKQWWLININGQLMGKGGDLGSKPTTYVSSLIKIIFFFFH